LLSYFKPNQGDLSGLKVETVNHPAVENEENSQNISLFHSERKKSLEDDCPAATLNESPKGHEGIKRLKPRQFLIFDQRSPFIKTYSLVVIAAAFLESLYVPLEIAF